MRVICGLADLRFPALAVAETPACYTHLPDPVETDQPHQSNGHPPLCSFSFLRHLHVHAKTPLFSQPAYQILNGLANKFSSYGRCFNYHPFLDIRRNRHLVRGQPVPIHRLLQSARTPPGSESGLRVQTCHKRSSWWPGSLRHGGAGIHNVRRLPSKVNRGDDQVSPPSSSFYHRTVVRFCRAKRS